MVPVAQTNETSPMKRHPNRGGPGNIRKVTSHPECVKHVLIRVGATRASPFNPIHLSINTGVGCPEFRRVRQMTLFKRVRP